MFAPGPLLALERDMRAQMANGVGATASESGSRVYELLDEAGAMVANGRHAAAERCLRALGAALARRRAFEDGARVLVRLGRHLLERGRADDAVRAFHQSIRYGADAGSNDAIVTARIWLASALIDAGRLVDAEGVCREVLAGRTVSPAEQVRATATYLRLLIWQRRLDEAVTRARDMVMAPDEAHTYARATLVRLEVARGRVFEAGLAAGALERALPSGADAVSRVIAATTRLRVLAAAGDLAAAMGACHATQKLARESRMPLRGVRARLIWADALRRAGDQSAARRVEDRLRRLIGLSPLLRCDVESQGRMEEQRSADVSRARLAVGISPRFAIELQMALRARCDAEAIRGVLELVVRDDRVGRAELFVSRGASLVLAGHAGNRGATTIGPRIAALGAEVGPVSDASSDERGVPLRDSGVLVGAVVLRCARGEATALGEQLEYLAGVLGPWVVGFDVAGESTHPASLMPELIGDSRLMTELRSAVQRAAGAPFAVLIEGESGVGKELVARALHRLGPRRDGPFRGLNCAALTEELVDAELFGHARGAFTGALTDRRGLIEEADGGTLFLDELADLSPRGQAKLLRVLQEREVRRIGEAEGRAVDVRVVSAANTDMRGRAERGAFRPDLLYRLDVIRLDIPSLRARPEDIAPLVRHYWRDAAQRMGSVATLSREVVEALMSHHWPGNVRELQNVVAAMSVVAPARGEVRLSHLPRWLQRPGARVPRRLGDARALFERRFIEAALARAGGRRTCAARDLGISRQGLAKLIRRHAVEAGVPEAPEPSSD